MAQTKKEFEVLDDFAIIAEKIVDKYPDLFYGLDVGAVRCVAVTNKDRPETRDKLWDVMPVKMPVRLDCPYGWYLIIHQSDWETLAEKQQHALVAEMLCSIPVGVDTEGKVLAPDYKGYSVILRTLGIDFLDNPKTPDILAEEVTWVK